MEALHSLTELEVLGAGGRVSLSSGPRGPVLSLSEAAWFPPVTAGTALDFSTCMGTALDTKDAGSHTRRRPDPGFAVHLPPHILPGGSQFLYDPPGPLPHQLREPEKRLVTADLAGRAQASELLGALTVLAATANVSSTLQCNVASLTVEEMR